MRHGRKSFLTLFLVALLTSLLSLSDCGGGGDTGSTDNNPPSATITSPSDGSSYYQGDNITFAGYGYDYRR